MRIGIIGTGNMAKAFLKRLATTSNTLLLGGRDLEKAAALGQSFGTVRTASISEVVGESELVIPALPYEQLLKVLPALANVGGKTLVDITNPITPDFKSLTIGFTSSAAEEIQKRTPGARVVKAFNTIFADVFDLTREQTRDTQVFYATDDDTAAQSVDSLIRAVGFKPISAGQLVNARYLEPLGELNIHFGYMLGRGAAIAPRWQSLSQREFA